MVAGEPCGHGPVAATEVDDFGATLATASIPRPRSAKRDRGGGAGVAGQVREQETRTDIDAGPGENATVSRDGEIEVGVEFGVGPGWDGSISA